MIRLTNNSRYLLIDGLTISTYNYVYDNTNIGVNILYPTHPISLLERYYVLYINKSGNTYDYRADFFPNSDGSLNINLSSILKILGINVGDSFTLDIIGYQDLEFLTSSFSFNITLTLHNGINRDSYIYPVCVEGVQNLGSSTSDKIFPPNKIYVGQGLVNGVSRYTPVIVETTLYQMWEGYNGSNWTSLSTYSGDSYVFNTLTNYYPIVRCDNKVGQYCINQELVCGEFVILRWKSIFGNTRQNVFLVESINDDTKNTQASIIGNGLSDFKTKTNSIVVSVKGLTRYGLWYYSDILNSEDIHITKNVKDSVINNSVNNTFNYLDTVFTKCTVKESNYTVEYNNNQFYDLSLTIEYSNYGFN